MDIERVLEVLSQVVTCPENCPTCRAAAQALLTDPILDVRVCPDCTRAYAPTLGPCRCAEPSAVARNWSAA